MPNDSFEFKYVVYPLQIGYCKLPNFHIKFVNNISPVGQNVEQAQSQTPTGTITTLPQISETSLDSVIQNMIPSQLFVFPEKTTDHFFMKIN